jgi:hypothetical protein
LCAMEEDTVIMIPAMAHFLSTVIEGDGRRMAKAPYTSEALYRMYARFRVHHPEAPALSLDEFERELCGFMQPGGACGRELQVLSRFLSSVVHDTIEVPAPGDTDVYYSTEDLYARYTEFCQGIDARAMGMDEFDRELCRDT